MHIDLKLGLSCNNACIHCIMEPVRKLLLRERKHIDASPDAVANIIRTLTERGVDSVTLTGGEPTLRGDFFTLLERLCQLDIAVTVQTNGRLLGGEKAAERLRALPDRRILFVVALHGSEAALHDAITRVRGSFDETVHAVHILHDLGFRVCGKMVLSRRNVNAVADTLDAMASLRMEEAIVAFPHAEGFTAEALGRVVPRYAEVRRALAGLSLSSGFHHHVFWETIPFCQLPGPDFYVRSVDLDFLRERLHRQSTCIEMSMTGQHINWEESRKSIKAKGKACSSCLLDRVCEGVWEEYLPLHGESDLEPVTDMNRIRAFLERL